MRIFLLGPTYDGSGFYTLTKGDRNYLTKVLRLKEGDALTARDSDNRYYRACMMPGGMLSLEETEKPKESLTDAMPSYTGKRPRIHLYQCVCKGKKNEDIARMACEAGVETFTTVESAFTQRSLSDHDRDRIRSIMKEAVQQSGSETGIYDGESLSLGDALKDARGVKIILHQGTRGKTVSLFQVLEGLEEDCEISLLVGSEGGFSEEECTLAENEGFTTVLLPTNILRAETAGIYAIGAIQCILCKNV